MVMISVDIASLRRRTTAQYAVLWCGIAKLNPSPEGEVTEEVKVRGGSTPHPYHSRHTSRNVGLFGVGW